MLKEMGYQEKIEWLKPWLVSIIEVVKKDLKQEHLMKDRGFCRRYFLGKGPHQVTSTEMAQAYATDIAAGNVGLGEFIATRWLIKNTDIYDFFSEQLQALNPDFDQLELLDEKLGLKLMEESVKAFGATRTYLFSVLNSVVFSSEIFKELRQLAEMETQKKLQQEEELLVEKNLEGLQKRHQREVQSLKEHNEKQLNGMRKKYLKDTELLKEQIRRLQSEKNG
ncbi:MAG: hypothetical protein JSS62_02430 [Verrucomicrobia bacterium]|nr:hypothetical protein [Verrucomicrobiota bacterium]MBS0646906.1 hypothetical protein [Verrucomicrobiota bacterium]